MRGRGMRHRLRLLSIRLRMVWIAIRGLLSSKHPLLVQMIPMRRCNLACTYCNEFDDHSPPVPSEEMKARMERAKEGPVVTMMVVSKEGIDMMAPSRFLVTLLLDIAAAFAAALILRRIGGGFASRFGTALVLGIFLAVGARAQDWLWWSHPTGFAVAGIVDAVLGWALAGAVLAAIVRPAAE